MKHVRPILTVSVLAVTACSSPLVSVGTATDGQTETDTESGTVGTNGPTTTSSTGSTTASSSTTNPTIGPSTTATTSTTDPTTSTTADTDPTTGTDTAGTETGDTSSSSTGPDPVIFDFREDGPDAYTRVDRKGFPGVNTALIASENEEAYNFADPTNDVAGDFVADILGTLGFLHNGLPMVSGSNGLDDELINVLGQTVCSRPGAGQETCMSQAGPLVLPDVLVINTTVPTGFPNGRGLETPVVDVILSVLLLELGDDPSMWAANGFFFVDLDAEAEGNQGLSQSGNNVDFPGAWPFLAAAN